jgi:GNAT superfamily N-acetyltransferase
MGAFRDGELVGTAGFAVQQGQKNAHKGRLWGMYVRPNSRNIGVGRLLVRAVLDVARENVELIQLASSEKIDLPGGSMRAWVFRSSV